jgi:hypothetical protein
MSSYLSLAAIENADLLAKHIQLIIDSIISGKRIYRVVERYCSSFVSTCNKLWLIY